ncbi:MAG: type I methionyl aminopeptidase [Acidobacteriota bacterium]|nr:type I methionyl aminopeptidase [Acidobacteriota bacterium]
MSVSIKSERELEIMRQVGRIVANALEEMRWSIEAGMTTGDLDRMAEAAIRRQGAEPAFPYINDFPGTVCTSVNNEVVHGIPGKRVLREGDLVKLDTGAILRGYHGDAALTVGVGKVSGEAHRLIEATEQALVVGIEATRAGGFLHDIGNAIQDFIDPLGYSIVRRYVGHGIGRQLHEDPTVPHYRQSTRGMKLRAGMVLTIEPMINEGRFETVTRPDGWTVVTRDGKLSAQFEHTVVIGEDGPEILTVADDGRTWSVPRVVAKSVS